MKKDRSLKHNFLMNAVLTMSSFIFPLISFPYVSRVLGPDGTGKVSFATSVASYFWMIAYLGIPTYGVRACARVRDDKEKLSRLVQELLIISLIMTIVAYVVFAVGIELVPRFQVERKLLWIISLEFFFYTIGIEWMYRGLEKYTYITITSLCFKAIAIVGMFLFIHSENDYVIYGALTIISSSASYLFNFFYSRKYIHLRPLGDYHFKRHLKPILIFFGMSCATTIYLHLDVAMLGFMKTTVDVGYYNAAVKVKVILVSAVTSLGHVLLPRSSYYIERGMLEEFYHIGRKAFEFVVLVATPLMVYFILYAGPAILLLSGEAYIGAIHPMQIIMPTLLLIGLSNLLGTQTLVPLGREKQVLWSVIAGAVTDVILNYLLIPHFGASGAAFGTVMAEAVVLAVQCFVLRKDMNRFIDKIPFGKILLAIVAGAVFSCLSVPLMSLILTDEMLPALRHFLELAVSASMFFLVYAVCLIRMKEPLFMEIIGITVHFFRKHVSRPSSL